MPSRPYAACWALVKHFGDLEDARQACGICDICASGETLLQRFRKPNSEQLRRLQQIMTALREHGRQTSGRLHRALFEDDEVSRNDFEDLVSALARAGLVAVD